MSYREVQRMPKATRLDDFINVFSLFPLEGENFENFYVDTSEVRGNEMKKLEYTCLIGNYPYAKILFSGQMGSGKTTELYNLTKNLADKYEIIKISVLQELDVYNMSYVDLVFAIMSAILKHFEECDEDFSGVTRDTFSQLYNYWHSEYFTTILFSDEKEAAVEADEEGAGSALIGTNFVAKLKFLMKVVAKGQSIFRTTSNVKEELKTKLSLRMGDLLSAINSMIMEVNSNFGEKDLMIIVEDLDKADPNEVTEIFTKHFSQLSPINTKIIFNIPIALEYSLDFKRIKDNSNTNFVLSVINVFDENGMRNASNIQFFRKLVYKRAEEKFFIDDVLDYMVEKSGGILRDLFAILVDASLNAIIGHRDVEQILMKDAEVACMKLRNEYVKSIETREQYDRLLDIYSNSNDTFEDEIILGLLQANLIIECGENKDYQVHPLVIDYMRYRGDIDD